ncbi:unannotated protein [freshwater metagenome]|uniref:Unannotated protein n=1 Tax=freshwater metagenome TaxID=449393 RepID=A0A6J7J2B1_9ZZZZ
MRDDDLLAEGIVGVRFGIVPLALTAPHADEWQQRQHRRVQIGAEPQVCGVVRVRDVGQHRDVARRRLGELLLGSRNGLVTAGDRGAQSVVDAVGVARARFRHDSSLTSR